MERESRKPNEGGTPNAGGKNSIEHQLLQEFLREHKLTTLKNFPPEEIQEHFNTRLSKKKGNVLESINKSNLDVAFKDISGIKLNLGDILEGHKKKNLNKSFAPQESEKSTVESAIEHLKEQSTTGPLIGINIDDFCREFGVSTNRFGKIELENTKQCRIKSLDDLHRAWASYLADQKKTEKVYTTALNHVEYDYSEQLTCQSYLRKMRNRIILQDDSGLLSHFDQTFGKEDLKSMNAFSITRSFNDLSSKLHDFFSSTNLDEKIIKDITSLSVSLGDVQKLGSQHGYIKDGNQLSDKKIVDLSQELYGLSEKFVKGYLSNHVVNSLKKQDETIKDTVRTIQAPKTLLGGLRDRFPHHNIIKPGEDINQQRESYFNHIEQSLNNIGKQFDKATIGTSCIQVMKKFRNNDRQLHTLSIDEQNTLLQTNVLLQMDAIERRDLALDFFVEKKDYYTFLLSLYDLHSKELIIPTSSETLRIPFTKKTLTQPYDIHNLDHSFKEHRTLDYLSINNLIKQHNFPLQFEIDYNNIPLDQLKFLRMIFGEKYLYAQNIKTSSGEEKMEVLSDRTKLKLTDKHGNSYEGYLSAKGFSPEDQNAVYDTYNGETNQNILGDRLFLYSHPVDELHQGDQREMMIKKDEQGNPMPSNHKSNKLLPIYIDKDNVHDYTIDVLDKKVAIGGDALQHLSTGYLAAQHDRNTRTTDPDSQSTINRIFSDLEQQENNEKDNDILDTKQEKSTNNTAENQEESFNEKRLKDNRKESFTFLDESSDDAKTGPSEGQRIWLAAPSVLPPIKDGHPEMSYIDIVSVKKKADGVVQDITIKFGGGTRSIGKFEGKTYTISPDKLIGLIDDRKNDEKYKNKVGSINNKPLISSKNMGDDFWSFKESLKGRYAKDWYSFPEMERLDYKNGKLFDGEENRPIQYFISKHKQKYKYNKEDQEYTARYKVELLPNKKCKVIAEQVIFNDDKKDKDGNTTEGPAYKLQWSREMDMQSMLLFMGFKDLKPTSDKDFENNKKSEPVPPINPPKDRKPWLTILDIVGAPFGKGKVAEIFNKYGKQAIDKRQELVTKDQQEKLERELFGKMKLFDKLSGIMPDWMTDRDMNVFYELNHEYDVANKSRMRKKIESWIKHYDKPMHHTQARPEIFGDLKKVIDLQEEGGTDAVPFRYRPMMFGACINMLQKEGPYAFRDSNTFTHGTWVKAILGKEAYLVYNRKYEELKAKFLPGSIERRSQIDVLSRFEFDFIVSLVRGGPHTGIMMDLYPKDFKLGDNHNAGRGTFTELYGREAGNNLGTAIEDYWKKGIDKGIIEEYEGTKNYDFVKLELEGALKQRRTNRAVGALIALAQLCRSQEQCEEFIKYATFAILSGVFVHSISTELRGQLRKALRTMKIGYANYLLDPSGQSNLADLVNFVSRGDFYAAKNEKTGKAKNKKTGKAYKAEDYDDNSFATEMEDKSSNKNEKASRTGLFWDDFKHRRDNGTQSDGTKNQKLLLDFLMIRNPQDRNSVISLSGKSPAGSPPKTYYGKEITNSQMKLIKSYKEESFDKLREFNKDGDVVGSMPLAFYQGDPYMVPWDTVSTVSKSINQQGEWGKQDGANDPAFAAQEYRTAMCAAAPDGSPKFSCADPQDRHLIYFYLEHFFNIFEWTGLGDGEFRTFYEYVRQAKIMKQKQKNAENQGNTELAKQYEQEVRRLVFYHPYKKIFQGRTKLPSDVVDTARKFCEFTLANLDHIDNYGVESYHKNQELESSRLCLGDEESKADNEFEYMPDTIWRDEKQRKEYMQRDNRTQDRYINYQMDMDVRSALGSYNSNNSTGITIDSRIGYKNNTLTHQDNKNDHLKIAIANGDKLDLLRSVSRGEKIQQFTYTRDQVEDMLLNNNLSYVTDSLIQNNYTPKEVYDIFEQYNVPVPDDVTKNMNKR